MVRILGAALLISSFAHSTLAAQSTPSSTSYDFIVVGGGTAGCLVASRLSEDKDVSVLLVESGPTNEGVLNAIIPYNFVYLFPNTPFDWNLTIVPQRGLNNRTLGYHRGHILGGSSSVNGMTYTRGPSTDWDRIARTTGDDSWTWDNLQPLIKRNEAFEIPPGNSSDEYDPKFHGFHGEVATSLTEYKEWIIQPALAAAQEANVPYNHDLNSGNPLGIGWDPVSVKHGSRSSSATAFINDQVKVRKNLHVLLNTQVLRVLPQNGSNPLKFNAIEYRDLDDNVAQATAKREIIISAGTMNTPPLLMRSGLGPAEEIQAAGITPLLDIPAVGKNLGDHVGIALAWKVDQNLTDDEIDRNITFRNELIAQWNQTHSGRLVENDFTHLMYSRVPDDDPIFKTMEDPSSGSVCPHYEQLLGNKWTGLIARPPGNFIAMTHFNTAPTSSGTVKLNVTDPTTGAVIDPAYLTTDWDILVLRTAIRSTLKYMNASVWQQWNATPVFDPSVADNDDTLDTYIRANAFGGVHSTSTARMGPPNSPPGADVVGPDFKVKGVQGLRIVDASVLPYTPAAHTQAPVYILAEKAVDVIRAAYRLSH